MFVIMKVGLPCLILLAKVLEQKGLKVDPNCICGSSHSCTSRVKTTGAWRRATLVIFYCDSRAIQRQRGSFPAFEIYYAINTSRKSHHFGILDKNMANAGNFENVQHRVVAKMSALSPMVNASSVGNSWRRVRTFIFERMPHLNLFATEVVVKRKKGRCDDQNRINRTVRPKR